MRSIGATQTGDHGKGTFRRRAIPLTGISEVDFEESSLRDGSRDDTVTICRKRGNQDVRYQEFNEMTLDCCRRRTGKNRRGQGSFRILKHLLSRRGKAAERSAVFPQRLFAQARQSAARKSTCKKHPAGTGSLSLRRFAFCVSPSSPRRRTRSYRRRSRSGRRGFAGRTRCGWAWPSPAPGAAVRPACGP